MKQLILTVGLPRSGKSTWAYKQGHPRVNPDCIRLALHGSAFSAVAEPFVWAIAKCMVLALFCAGHDTVILDACNVTAKRRDEWVSPDEWQLRVEVFRTSPEECIVRARAADREDLIPVIQRMAAEWDFDTDTRFSSGSGD